MAAREWSNSPLPTVVQLDRPAQPTANTCVADRCSTAHANRHRNTLPLLCLAAAGGSVEPFWGLYQQHQKPEIRDILSKYRIGTLKGAPKMAAVQEVRARDLAATAARCMSLSLHRQRCGGRRWGKGAGCARGEGAACSICFACTLTPADGVR